MFEDWLVMSDNYCKLHFCLLTVLRAHCGRACTREYQPKCGTDGNTYDNQCLLDIAICEDPSLYLASHGACPTPTRPPQPPPGTLNLNQFHDLCGLNISIQIALIYCGTDAKSLFFSSI